jgi:hypothetical protein
MFNGSINLDNGATITVENGLVVGYKKEAAPAGTEAADNVVKPLEHTGFIEKLARSIGSPNCDICEG